MTVARSVLLTSSVILVAHPAAAQTWSRVRALAPGDPLSVTADRAPGERYFLHADDSELTLLNVSDMSIPNKARELLRSVARLHPEYFRQARANATFVWDHGVRMNAAGLSADGRWAATLGQIVESVSREKVDEITVRHKGRGVWAHLGAMSSAAFRQGSLVAWRVRPRPAAAGATAARFSPVLWEAASPARSMGFALPTASPRRLSTARRSPVAAAKRDSEQFASSPIMHAC